MPCPLRDSAEAKNTQPMNTNRFFAVLSGRACGLGVLLMSAVALTSSGLAQSTYNYDFNAGQADFQTNFSNTGFSAPYYHSSGGISDSGDLGPDGGSNEITIYKTGFVNTG